MQEPPLCMQDTIECHLQVYSDARKEMGWDGNRPSLLSLAPPSGLWGTLYELHTCLFQYILYLHGENCASLSMGYLAESIQNISKGSAMDLIRISIVLLWLLCHGGWSSKSTTTSTTSTTNSTLASLVVRYYLTPASVYWHLLLVLCHGWYIAPFNLKLLAFSHCARHTRSSILLVSTSSHNILIPVHLSGACLLPSR